MEKKVWKGVYGFHWKFHVVFFSKMLIKTQNLGESHNGDYNRRAVRKGTVADSFLIGSLVVVVVSLQWHPVENINIFSENMFDKPMSSQSCFFVVVLRY